MEFLDAKEHLGYILNILQNKSQNPEYSVDQMLYVIKNIQKNAIEVALEYAENNIQACIEYEDPHDYSCGVKGAIGHLDVDKNELFKLIDND